MGNISFTIKIKFYLTRTWQATDVVFVVWWCFHIVQVIEESIIWIIDGSNGLKLKCLIDGFVSYKHTAFTSQDINWWTGVLWIIVMYLSVFGLSFWRHPFTAEDPLLSKCYISPSLMKKLIYILDVPRVSKLSGNFHFFGGVNFCC